MGIQTKKDYGLSSTTKQYKGSKFGARKINKHLRDFKPDIVFVPGLWSAYQRLFKSSIQKLSYITS
jgi:hypothetical protein